MRNTTNIALVIKTDGLEYDDRVRKEILSVQRLFPQVRFKIFAMLPENKRTQGVTGYGVPYESVYIPARDKYPSASKTMLKAYQFYKAVAKELRQFDAIWVGEEGAVFAAMLAPKRHLLWDLHELPKAFIGSWVGRMILRYIFNRCRVVVHANPQRERYLEGIGVVADARKHFALRNYPDFADVDVEHDEKFQQFVAWKGDRECVYLQGLDEQYRRASYESVAAVLRTPDLCAVVVGKFDEQSRERLLRDFGEELERQVMFVGRVPQLKIPQYVQQCRLTLVFYLNISPNNYYCEANRFYQAVILGIPVVTGDNPPMRELTEQYGFGVSIAGDGSDIDQIVRGIQTVRNDYDRYHDNCLRHRDQLLWDNQDETIKSIMKMLIE